MKKRIIIGSIIAVIGIIVYIFPSNRYQEKEIITNEKIKEPDGYTGISMMYETDEGSGEYVASEESNWLGNGYYFNSELSSCENGGTLTWNDTNKTVKLSTNKSDKCYVYFDKAPKIEVLSIELHKSKEGTYLFHSTEDLSLTVKIKNNTDSSIDIFAIDFDHKLKESITGIGTYTIMVQTLKGDGLLEAQTETDVIFYYGQFMISNNEPETIILPIFYLTSKDLNLNIEYALPEITLDNDDYGVGGPAPD